ncbi:MAG: site-specific DNA-methyltransferase [Acidobacteria bacterium]|nr:site-specific DNA-methyltransferase [Acidobacteriota bacterium]
MKRSRVTQSVEAGDCVEKMAALNPGIIDLALCDPPYNLGMDYDAYDDNRDHEEYLRWTRSWLAEVTRALHKHGTLWIFCPDEWVSEIDLLARRKFQFYKRRHVIWAFTFGQANQKNFSRSHAHILYLTKTKTRFTFNDAVLRVPSARQLVYKDKRQNPAGKLPDDTWMLLREQLEPYLTPDKDTWLESRICGTFRERRKHSPNQIPVPLMERLVLATSNPGDLVLDPFCGTGSSGVACAKRGRNYLAFDLSKECVRQSRQRIQEALA